MLSNCDNDNYLHYKLKTIKITDTTLFRACLFHIQLLQNMIKFFIYKLNIKFTIHDDQNPPIFKLRNNLKTKKRISGYNYK